MVLSPDTGVSKSKPLATTCDLYTTRVAEVRSTHQEVVVQKALCCEAVNKNGQVDELRGTAGKILEWPESVSRMIVLKCSAWGDQLEWTC